ncbi:MAG: DUF3997 domain-containing protein [Clostridia bacterium]|nr:DUF3997 domain-containing protein [Clostridia bacterium]
MKNKAVLTGLLLVLLLTSCAGASDWSYKLPNDYEVWRINSKDIIVKYVGDKAVETEIPSFVKEFSYDDRYVCTRNIESIDENDIFSEEYYILDTGEQKLYGPYETQEEFKLAIEEMKISLVKWYRTSPDPNMMENSR